MVINKGVERGTDRETERDVTLYLGKGCAATPVTCM